MDYSKWITVKVDPLDIALDELNPRVLLENYSQENMRSFLIEHFDVIGLANSITVSGGLPPTERILCIKEDDKYIVVEGNRRVTACQLLKKPDLTPKDFRHLIQTNSNVKKQLKEIEIVVAPNRDVTENYITMRHTGKGTKPWSRLAENRRYIIRYTQKKQSINHISKVLNIPPGQIKKGLQFYFFVEYIKKELNWNSEESAILNTPLLEATKLDRFLPFSKYAKDIMKISFNSNCELQYDVKKENFDKALKIIVGKIFITEELNTRSSFKEVFTDEIVKLCSVLKPMEEKTKEADTKNDTDIKDTMETDTKKNDVVLSDTDKNNPGAHDPVLDNLNATDINLKEKKPNQPIKSKIAQPKQPKPKDRVRLFEGLIYKGDHRGIERALYELQSINVNNYSLSATYLTRTLLECTLQEYLTLNGSFDQWKKKNQDPSLTDLLNYCIQHKSLASTSNNIQRSLSNAYSLKDHDQLNSVTHAKYNEPSIDHLWSIEKRWYSVIEFFFDNLNNKLPKNDL